MQEQQQPRMNSNNNKNLILYTIILYLRTSIEFQPPRGSPFRVLNLFRGLWRGMVQHYIVSQRLRRARDQLPFRSQLRTLRHMIQALVRCANIRVFVRLIPQLISQGQGIGIVQIKQGLFAEIPGRGCEGRGFVDRQRGGHGRFHVGLLRGRRRGRGRRNLGMEVKRLQVILLLHRVVLIEGHWGCVRGRGLSLW